MKNKITLLERDEILRQHEKYNKLINEQKSDLESRLQKIMDSGCVAGKKFIQEFETYSKPEYKFAIAQESSKNQGVFRYLFIDNRVGKFDISGKWEWIGKWSCDNYISNMETQKLASDSERIKIANNEGFYTIDQWLKQGVDIKSNIQNYQEKEIGSTKLYKRKDFGTQGGTTDKQKAVLDNIKALNGKTQSELTPEELVTWRKQEVIPPGNPDFPDGLYAYFPPSKESRDKVVEKYNDVRGKTRLDEKDLKDCSENIKNWYMDWEDKIDYIPTTHNSTKQLVQMCVNQLRISGLGKAFGNTDNYIRRLTGQEDPGPMSDNKYYLQRPNR